MSKIKLSHSQENLVKHYLYALVVAVVAIYKTGNHSIKSIAWGALIAVFSPVVESVWIKIKANKVVPVVVPVAVPTETPKK